MTRGAVHSRSNCPQVGACQLHMLRDQFKYLTVFQRKTKRQREKERERGGGRAEDSVCYLLSETVTGLDKLT